MPGWMWGDQWGENEVGQGEVMVGWTQWGSGDGEQNP